jgi:hypothetical protein
VSPKSAVPFLVSSSQKSQWLFRVCGSDVNEKSFFPTVSIPETSFCCVAVEATNGHSMVGTSPVLFLNVFGFPVSDKDVMYD